jgi:hypothetical protein
MSCPGDLYVVPGAAPCAGGGGVTTLNSLTGGINLTSVSGSIIIAPLGNDIDFTAGGVTSLNTLNGNLNLISSDASVTITPSGTDIDLTATVPTPSLPTAYFDPTTAISSLTSTLQTIFSIPFTITTAGSILCNSKLSLFNAGVVVGVVATIIQIDTGTGVIILNPATVTTIAGSSFIAITNNAMANIGPGSYTLNLLANTDPSVPPGTISIVTPGQGSLNMITNLVQASSFPQTFVSAATAPFTGVLTIPGFSPIEGFTGLPIINEALNPTVTVTVTIAGSGSVTANPDDGFINIGIFQSPSVTQYGGVNLSGNPIPSFNYGTTIPDGLNSITTFTIPTSQFNAGNFVFGFFYQGGFSPPYVQYAVSGLYAQLSITYNV